MLLQRAVDNFAYRLNKSRDIVAKQKIEDDILTSYATIVERKMGKRTGVVYGLLDFIIVPMTEHKDVKYSPYQSHKKSLIEIPRVLTAPQQDCGYTVSSEDGVIPYSYIRPERIKHRNRNVSKFIADNPINYFTLIERKIYIWSNSKTIRVSGIFANPKEIAEYKRTDKTQPLIVHIDDDLFRGIKQLMIEEYPEYAPLREKDIRIEEEQIRNE